MKHARLTASVVLFFAASCSDRSARDPLAVSPDRFAAIRMAADPALFLPGDLDCVVRIDAARLRASPLGPELSRIATQRALADVDGADVLDHADVVTIGLRASREGVQGDGVLAVTGWNAEQIARPEKGWQKIAQWSEGGELFERAPPAPGKAEEARNSPALLARTPTGFIAATRAEADALLRVLRDGPDAARLAPPAEGLLSFAARSSVLHVEPAADGGTSFVGRLAEGLDRFTGVVRFGTEIEVAVDVAYITEKNAAQGSAELEYALSVLKGAGERFPPVLRGLLEHAQVAQKGDTVFVSSRLGLQIVGPEAPAEKHEVPLLKTEP